MIKKLICLILCFAVMTIFIPSAYASSTNEDVPTLDQYISYAYSSLPALSRLPDVEFPVDGIYISQPLEIINDANENSYVFFIFDQGTCIGELIVAYIDGEFHSSFLYAELSVVSNAYEHSISFTLLSLDNILLMYTAESTEIIVGNGVVDDALRNKVSDYYAQNSVSEYTENVLVLTFIPSSVSPRYSGLPYSTATLDVPFVDNLTDPDGFGLCWAACVASIVRFHRPTARTDAWTVYSSVLMEYGAAAGYSSTVKNALDLFGILGYRYTTSQISIETLTASIDNGHPVIISMGIAPGVGDKCHFVVVCGYRCESDGTDYLQIVDSNVDTGKIWISVNRHSQTNTIYYLAPYKPPVTYREWFETIYHS